MWTAPTGSNFYEVSQLPLKRQAGFFDAPAVLSLLQPVCTGETSGLRPCWGVRLMHTCSMMIRLQSSVGAMVPSSWRATCSGLHSY